MGRAQLRQQIDRERRQGRGFIVSIDDRETRARNRQQVCCGTRGGDRHVRLETAIGQLSTHRFPDRPRVAKEAFDAR